MACNSRGPRPAASLRQHCPQMTQRRRSVILTKLGTQITRTNNVFHPGPSSRPITSQRQLCKVESRGIISNIRYTPTHLPSSSSQLDPAASKEGGQQQGSGIVYVMSLPGLPPSIHTGLHKRNLPRFGEFVDIFRAHPSNLRQSGKHSHQIFTKPGKVSLVKA